MSEAVVAFLLMAGLAYSVSSWALVQRVLDLGRARPSTSLPTVWEMGLGAFGAFVWGARHKQIADSRLSRRVMAVRYTFVAVLIALAALAMSPKF